MIKTVPHGTVSPHMMYKKYKRLAYTSPDLLARFCKINCKVVEPKKLGLICFLRSRAIYSQTRSSVPVANELMNSLTEK